MAAEDLFEVALADYLDVQERRVREMYNRTRAVFAEFLVAAALNDSAGKSVAHVVEDPAAAWDLDWMCKGRAFRLEVKCTGEHLPRRPGRPAPAKWTIPAAKKGWDPHQRRQLDVGLHCDAFVLAQHKGGDVRTGWSFRVVLAGEYPPGSTVTPALLGARGVESEELSDLLQSRLLHVPR